MNWQIAFVDSTKAPVELQEGDCLSEKLNIQNSPILFGCRIGICGTCAIEILEQQGPALHPRTHEEDNFLETMAPGQPHVRLACQIHINTNLKVRQVEI